MNSIHDLMRRWQTQQDEEVNLFDRKVKYYVSYDSWDDRFFIESCTGFIDFNLVYFSSKEKAQGFLNECEEQLKQLIKELKESYR